jgi:hypothetical protein
MEELSYGLARAITLSWRQRVAEAAAARFRGKFGRVASYLSETSMAYKIQHLGLGGILDQAIAITKDHFGLLFTIMLLLLVPFNLLVGLISVAAIPELAATPSSDEIEAFLEARSRFMPFAAIAGFINALIIYPLTNAAVIQAVARLYLGQPITALESIRHGLKRLLPLIGTSILMYLAILGGLILLIVPGILFALWFGLSQHVVVIEEVAGQAALSRSKKLVRPHLGTFLMLGVVLFVIGAALGFGAALIPQPHLKLIVSTLLQAVTTIVWTAAGVVFYFSCRCAVENFDLHYLAEAIGAPDAEGEQLGQRAF